MLLWLLCGASAALSAITFFYAYVILRTASDTLGQVEAIKSEIWLVHEKQKAALDYIAAELAKR